METVTVAPETNQQVSTVGSAVKLIREIKRATYKRFTAEEKIRIVLEGFKREMQVSELCRKEGIASSVYYKWLKDFMEAGKSRLKGDSLREATRDEVEQLKRENEQLKKLLGEQGLELYLLKKSVTE
jgi:transposase